MFHYADEFTEEVEPYTAPVNVYIELPVLRWDGVPGWRSKAACRGVSTELFFRRTAHERIIEACNECPVNLVCLEFAIRNDLQFGIYGGKTGPERKGLTVEDIKQRSEMDEIGNQASDDSTTRQMESWCGSGAWWVPLEYWL